MTTESKTPKPEEVARKALLHKERGNSYYVRHQFSQALDWYTKAVEMNPEAYDVYTNRASTYVALQMWEDALADAREAVRIKPDWLKGYYRMGLCLVELKQYQKASRVFERGLKIHPENDQMAKELKKVKEHLRSLPKSAQDAKALGNELFKEGKYEEALRLYKEALVLTGKSEIDHDLRATILINCAEVYRQLEEYEMVIDQCDKALELKKASVKAHLRRALACEKLEKRERARGDFKTVIELDPTNHIASAGLIRCAKARQIHEQ
jgi:tetratricopeptide (TPR) repeat protein